MVKTRGKKISVLITAVIVALVMLYCLLRFGFSVDVLDRSGWKTKDGVVRYLDYYGHPQTRWQEIDGKLYYFTPEDGGMVTGWYTVDNDRYYFGDDGVSVTGWLSDKGNTYFLDNNGKMLAGWQRISGNTYHFAEDGVMAVGWQQINGNTYHFAENGIMAVGWQQQDGNRMYFSEEGILQTGWQTLDGKCYFFTQEGCAVSGWVELEDIRYRFDEDGSVVTGWFVDETGRYFFGEDGKPYSGWLDWEQERYYLNADGSMATGWLTLEQDRYYLREDGTMAVGEVEIDGVSSFFTSKGKYVLMTNPWHAVPEDYVLDLVEIEGYEIAREAREPLQQMMDACRAAGIRCVIDNSYRSKETQQWMWDQSVARYMAAGFSEAGANAKTGTKTALPGHSEHQTGLAVDITGGQGVYAWLGEHCWEYGFILRYPDDRMEITGIIYEPWHFRYVGTELSLELRELGLCMEEYMAMLTEQERR